MSCRVPERGRRRSLFALALVVAGGLLSRCGALHAVLSEYFGDALYAAAAFWVAALWMPRASSWALSVAAFAASAAVEGTQLLRWPWLVELRSEGLGALLLGQGFQVADLLAYLLGAASAGLADAVLRLRRRGEPEDF